MNDPKKIKKPIFVFGCPNSGTTILWQALKKHPELSGPDIEGQDLAELPDSMKHWLGKPTFRLWAHPKFSLCYYLTKKDFNNEDAGKIKAAYGQYIQPGARLITKSPADTLRARLIQAIFPDAYFIAIVRNGYATTEGIVRKRFYDPDRPQFAGLSTTIEEAAEQWFRANVIIVSHQNFLERYKIIRYEDLVEKPVDILHSIMDFCRLDKDSLPIPKFDKSKNQIQIVRLSEADIKTITRIGGPMLNHFGYEILAKKPETIVPDLAKPIIWLTGQTGSGKTTIARLLKQRIGGVVLDGNEMRESISLGIGFSKKDRREHNLRVARLAKVLANDVPVIVAVIAPFTSIRQKIDKIIQPIWVYVERKVEICSEKPYEIPQNYDIKVNSDQQTSEEQVELIWQYLREVK